LEPSVARRILVGKILIPNLQLSPLLHANCIKSPKTREA
jgi:hypothetical protein